MRLPRPLSHPVLRQHEDLNGIVCPALAPIAILLTSSAFLYIDIGVYSKGKLTIKIPELKLALSPSPWHQGVQFQSPLEYNVGT